MNTRRQKASACRARGNRERLPNRRRSADQECARTSVKDRLTTMRSAQRVLLLSLLILVAPVVAGDLTQRWSATLKATGEQLARGEYRDALIPLQNLSRELLDKLGTGEDADRFFAVVITQLALAEAGADRVEDAVWHWRIAQNIHPALKTADFSQFGEPGRVLSTHLLEPGPSKCPTLPPGSARPTVSRRREPLFPEGARQFRQSGIVIIHVRIDEQGNLSAPHV